MELRTVLLAALLSTLPLTACGGGGAEPLGGGPPPGPPIHIQMAISKGGTGANPVYDVSGVILRGTATLVADAKVSVNGVNIPYVGLVQQYQLPDAPIHVLSGVLLLKVQVDGVTYFATAEEYTTVSAFTGPAPSAVVAATTTTFSWNPTLPSGHLSGYSFKVTCFQQPAFRCPLASLPLLPIGVITFTVAAGTFTAGLDYAAQVTPVQEVPIPGATSSSRLVVHDATGFLSSFLFFTAQ